MPPQGLGYALGQSGKGVAIHDIKGICRGMAVMAGNFGSHRLGRSCVAVENGDLRPCRGERAARRRSDPAPAAGDERDFSDEILSHFLNPCHWRSSSNALASLRSGVSKPSVNQP